MNHFYVLSNKQKKMLRTQKYNDIESVLLIINQWQMKAGLATFDDVDAFEASVYGASKNGFAFPIDTNPLVLWNVYCV